MSSKATVILGAQWGDEGKGKLVDILCQDHDFCCRCQGGDNAGHTIVVNGVKFDFHILPSGLISKQCTSVIGNGVVIHLPSLFTELEKLTSKGIDPTNRLFISDRGLRIHHLFDFPQFESKFRTIVSNRKKRYGDFEYDIKAELELYAKLAQKVKPLVIDTISFINEQFALGKRVLVEGANALMLDIDFGTYPFVTSSNTCVGGVCTGLGIPPRSIENVIGVVKAYTTRVGSGPFPTEQLNEVGEKLQNIGMEVGTTTGRKRRCGWLDLVVVKYAHMINGFSSINITKLDVLDTFDEIKIGVSYKHNGTLLKGFPSDLKILSGVEVVYETVSGWNENISECRTFELLPLNAQLYIKKIESLLGIKVEWIGVGAGRDAMIKI